MSEYLKCDADDCGHVETVNTITAAHVDMPCPKCGANLLTRADWEAWRPIQALMQIVETIGVPEKGEPTASIRVGLHGRKTSIEIEPAKGPTDD